MTRSGPLRQVKKRSRPIPILVTIKIQKNCKDFLKALEIKTRGTTAEVISEVTTAIKNNDSGINNCNTTTKTELEEGRYKDYFKVPVRDYSNSKESYSELQRRKPQKLFSKMEDCH